MNIGQHSEVIQYGLLIAVVLLYRLGATMSGHERLGLFRHAIAGMWLGVAAWLAGALLHAWVALWQMVVVGIAVGVAVRAFTAWRGNVVCAVADVTVVVAAGLLSAVPVGWKGLVISAVAFAGAGFAIDRAVQTLAPAWRRLFALLPIMPVVVTLVRLSGVQLIGQLWREDWLLPARFAIAAPYAGDRVALPSGNVAWLRVNQSAQSEGVAVFAHGNDPQGSRQATAVALQNAFLMGGWHVLSVDAPGYGASPRPATSSEWAEWDPSVGFIEALKLAPSLLPGGASRRVLVGHSMGVDVILRVLATDAPIERAYLFGGTVSNPTWTEEFWVRRFHFYLGMPCCMPLEKLRRIRSEFHNPAAIAQRLPPRHAPVCFVRFGKDFADVTQYRNQLYDLIPGSKRACDLPLVTHFMNSLPVGDFALVDMTASRRVASLVMSKTHRKDAEPESAECD